MCKGVTVTPTRKGNTRGFLEFALLNFDRHQELHEKYKIPVDGEKN
jgi:hypothetical protein